MDPKQKKREKDSRLDTRGVGISLMSDAGDKAREDLKGTLESG